ncbi:MAG: DUF692 family protein [Deltaproteobacteria bacterium]|nr:DUF692 family protein [Deltaproteobacteria bacterium]
MPTRFPSVPTRVGLAVGLDMPWGSPRGFVEADDDSGSTPAPAVTRFLERYADWFTGVFTSIQPRRRQRWQTGVAAPYVDANARLRRSCPAAALFSLHHTQLDTAQPCGFDESGRAELFAFTNALVEATGAAWVNEDLGIWTFDGKPLPYPLPPLLTTASLRRCIATVRTVQAKLVVPFVLELPGFSEGAGFWLGDLDPLAFFRTIVEETDSPCTIDIAHLLGIAGVESCRDHADDVIARLPLDACIDLHLSGAHLANGAIVDAHHGVLLDEQLDLLEALLPRCPNLRVITYEDPRFLDDGRLVPKALRNAERLRGIAAAWSNGT